MTAALLVVGLVTAALVGQAEALPVELGQHVEVVATHPAGVPVHREARSSMFARVPTGATGEVLEIAGHWLRVKFDVVEGFDPLEGWITETYVARVFDPPVPCVATASPAGPTIASLWASASPGAALCLEPGEYSGADQAIAPPENLSGEMGKPITVQPLGQVRILGGEPADPDCGTAVCLRGNRHLVIEPVEVCNEAGTYCHVWSRRLAP